MKKDENDYILERKRKNSISTFKIIFYEFSCGGSNK